MPCNRPRRLTPPRAEVQITPTIPAGELRPGRGTARMPTRQRVDRLRERTHVRQPGDTVPATVATRQPERPPHRKVHRPPRPAQLVGDLAARLAAADDQDRARWQLGRAEARDDLVAAHETVGAVAGIRQAGQPEMPVGRDQAQRIPAPCPPVLGDATLFEHDMVAVEGPEVIAQRQPRRPAPDNRHLGTWVALVPAHTRSAADGSVATTISLGNPRCVMTSRRSTTKPARSTKAPSRKGR